MVIPMMMALGIVRVGFSISFDGITASSNPAYAQKIKTSACPKWSKPSGAKGTKFA